MLLVGLMPTLIGCGHPYRETANPFPVLAGEYDRLYEASRQVLKDRGYTLARQSYRFGNVMTEPKTSPTFAEPWHGDNSNLYLAGQSTLRHLRRQITVTIQPSETDTPAVNEETDEGQPPKEGPTVVPVKPGGQHYELRVEVTLEARQRPTRRLIGAAGRSGFSHLSEVPTEWARRGIPGSYWQPVGRDRELEARLVQDIVRRATELIENEPT